MKTEAEVLAIYFTIPALRAAREQAEAAFEPFPLDDRGGADFDKMRASCAAARRAESAAIEEVMNCQIASEAILDAKLGLYGQIEAMMSRAMPRADFASKPLSLAGMAQTIVSELRQRRPKPAIAA